jgi:hypothetical protein
MGPGRRTPSGPAASCAALIGRTDDRNPTDHHQCPISPLQSRGRSLIAGSMSSVWQPLLDHTPGSRFFSRSTTAAASSASTGRDLPMSTTGWLGSRPWPTAGMIQPRPEERTWQPLPITPARAAVRSYAATAAPQRNGSPRRQIVCKSTASLRARPARALLAPARLASRTAQALAAHQR